MDGRRYFLCHHGIPGRNMLQPEEVKEKLLSAARSYKKQNKNDEIRNKTKVNNGPPPQPSRNRYKGMPKMNSTLAMIGASVVNMVDRCKREKHHRSQPSAELPDVVITMLTHSLKPKHNIKQSSLHMTGIQIIIRRAVPP